MLGLGVFELVTPTKFDTHGTVLVRFSECIFFNYQTYVRGSLTTWVAQRGDRHCDLRLFLNNCQHT